MKQTQIHRRLQNHQSRLGIMAMQDVAKAFQGRGDSDRAGPRQAVELHLLDATAGLAGTRIQHHVQVIVLGYPDATPFAGAQATQAATQLNCPHGIVRRKHIGIPPPAYPAQLAGCHEVFQLGGSDAQLGELGPGERSWIRHALTIRVKSACRSSLFESVDNQVLKPPAM